MYEIIIGRNKEDKEKYGTEGTIFLGKHYVKMGQTDSLSSKIYMDISSSHVVFVCGKRGGGKSYSLGVISEGLSTLPENISKNISIIILDTMGIYWTMKYPNHKDNTLLNEWGLKSKAIDIDLYTPKGFFKNYKDKGVPIDYSFAIKPSELSAVDWCLTFDINLTDSLGVLIERTIIQLNKLNKDYSIEDIVEKIKEDTKTEEKIKNAAINRFLNANEWGLFDENGTNIEDLAKPGKVTVLDLGCYATAPNGWKIKSLVTGLVSQKIFIQRLMHRREEEYESVQSALHYFGEEIKKQEMPLVWLVIDEAHEFLPREGKTSASDALITILREGRGPGVSLILASQQPGKIHTDVITQSDTVISHRLTAKVDIEALKALTQSYMQESLVKHLNELPRVKGAGIIFDDTNEKLYALKIRPRFSWHGGSNPVAISEKKSINLNF